MEVNVRKFMYENITPYDGDDSFLVGPSEKTVKLWDKAKELLKEEFKNGGIYDVDCSTIPSIAAFGAGYIDKDLETIVGFQTDKPLKRGIKPYGGVNVVATACTDAGRELDPKVEEIFTKYRKTHNDGVFDAYTDEMRLYRKVGIITGLPDNYGRGRIIGDYRRLALYGADYLIAAKKEDRATLLVGPMTDELMRLREETMEQIRALEEIKVMANYYGFDVSKPASNAREAVQWTYFAFLSALKEQDGAAMSLGNVSSFLDIYFEKDLKEGKITEVEAQEIVDHFVMKLRMVRHLRPNSYNDIFAGDPTWLTESVAGTFADGKHKVTKTTYRFMHTLYNLGPSPEPNLTVLWSENLPENFKKFCSKVSIDTSSIQYENDDLMKKVGGCDDYSIACCVSQMETGKQMQFFGARCNIAKALLLAINEGKDEKSGVVVVPGIPALKSQDILDYNEVMANYKKVTEKLAETYVNTMNVIHYMHDKYYYERAQLAFMDTHIGRLMAFGAAGLSVVADSFSAIKKAKVTPVRNESGITVDFKVEGDFPKYGNDNDEVDSIAQDLVSSFMAELKKHHIYRNATPTLSILTITSNVMYGQKTGATPDGRKAGEAFAPGANPMHGRDENGALASLNSVAKIDYEYARDGVSNTFSILPQVLGSTSEDQIDNLTSLLNGYFAKNAHHLNVNVLNKETLLDAMEHPENHPQLTIRVSGYAVNFVKLSREQQMEVLSRTFHERI